MGVGESGIEGVRMRREPRWHAFDTVFLLNSLPFQTIVSK